MKSKRSQEGYLLIDNSAAGVGPKFETPTITCSHCHCIVVLNPLRTRPRGHCRKCDHYVCDKPGCNIECNPFNKLLDELQTKAEHALIIL